MPRKKRAVRAPRIDTVLSKLSLAELRSALERRQLRERDNLAGLLKKRATLAAELASLDADIAEIEGAVRSVPAGKRGPGRPPKAAGAGAKPGRKPGRPANAKAVKATKHAPKRKPGRPKGSKNVVKKGKPGASAGRKPTQRDLAAEVLQAAGKPMHQRDIAARMIADKGLKTTNKTFERSLGLLMSQDTKQFRKVKRAVYTLR